MGLLTVLADELGELLHRHGLRWPLMGLLAPEAGVLLAGAPPSCPVALG